MKRSVGWIKLVLKFSFAFFVIGYMIYSDRLDVAIVKRGFSSGSTVLICLGLLIFSACIAFYRWLLLARGQGLNFSFYQVVRYGLIGCFFNTTMPGAVSGDIIKAWYVIGDHKGQEKTPVLTSILLDRVMGVFGLVIVSTTALFLNWNQVWEVPQLKHIAYFVLLLALGVFAFFLYVILSVWGPLANLRRSMGRFEKSKLGRAFLKAYDSLLVYRENFVILIQSLILSIFTHLTVVTAVIFCAQALGEGHIAFYHYFLLVPLGLLTTAIPIAPAGLGVGHVAFGSLFSVAGSSHGAEIFTLYVTIQIIVNLSGVFFYVRSPKLVTAPENGA